MTVNVGSGGIAVSATESDPTAADAVTATTTLVLIGIAGVTDMNATADIGTTFVNNQDVGDNVEAFLGPEAGTTPTNALTTLTSGGAVTFTSNSTTTAYANASGGSGGGISVGVSYVTTTLDGTTQAYAGGKAAVASQNASLSTTGPTRPPPRRSSSPSRPSAAPEPISRRTADASRPRTSRAGPRSW